MHEGHRQRMYEKLNNSDDLFDHEVLEILLYNAYPRINTNPIAHALLDRFVSLQEVFHASVEELKTVHGVGDSVAKYIRTVGLCYDRADKSGNAPTLRNLSDCKNFVHLRLHAKSEEFVELYFLNKAYRVERIFSYTTGEKSRASAKIEVIAKNAALFHPFAIIIAHNHVDGNITPSCYDDNFTCAVQFICNMNGIDLSDHLIYLSRDEIFSYREDGRLDKIKNSCNWDSFGKWTETLN